MINLYMWLYNNSSALFNDHLARQNFESKGFTEN